MRNFSNQNGNSNSSSGRTSSGNGKPSNGSSKPSNGNRSGYQGQNRSSGSGGGYNRENRDNRSGGYKGGSGGGYNRENREGSGNRSGGYKGGSGGGYNRENRDNRGGPSSSRPSHGGPPHRTERHERHDRGNEGNYDRKGSSWVEISARSVEDAIEEAARRFNVNKADLKTEVLDEGSKGFLGIGSKPAKVKVSLKPSSVAPFAEGILSRLLRGMSLPDKVKVQKDSDGNTVLNIQGPSSGTLIGRHGHTLEALQYLVSKVVQRMTGEEKTIVVVDVENYLERQKDKLKDLAVNLAQKAKETGVEIPMRPMSSKDRRVVHLALKDHEHVTTESRGEGLRRKVVIVPKVKATEVTPEAAAAAQAAGDVAPAETDAPTDSQPVSGPVPVAPPAQPVGESQTDFVKISTPGKSVDDPDFGNKVPVEKSIDDNIGNRA
jgi:spoIIIJ-associated protein